MENPHHQILPILYPEYDLLLELWTKNHHQILTSLYPDYHVFGGMENLITKSFEFSIQTTTCLEDMEKPSSTKSFENMEAWNHTETLEKQQKQPPHFMAGQPTVPPLNVPIVI